ncbi:D-xylose reductase [Coemansia spiralis]|uniref:D-xylose reductase n=2 Tax=Coemansia TaxID=4863 RepID=A0A9W8G4L0_9FUNG|nr:xylose reductase [Coemansia spiralis]KAJ1995335.1 D-xylose reductase [Coemansia umbellata]KAJ2624838.1 D-xylose reductase [Coemansia sp. RSA 1358]KAJ2674362.1 D-xylose reductase [Coemansia spiralis]
MVAAEKTITLYNGLKMPTVGLGLWKITRETIADQVYQAIKLGYRLFDGACDYGNEAEAGQGIRRAIDEGLVKRSDLFITSKLWCTYHAREHVKPALKRTLSDLGLDYIDLYLVHFPIALKFVPFEKRYPPGCEDENGNTNTRASIPFQETWDGMEELYNEGLAKNIGISNMSGAIIYDLLSYAKVKPAVLQIELHPYLVRKQLVDLAHAHGIAVTAYSSFGDASYTEMGFKAEDPKFKHLLKHDLISEIAQKHGKSPAQILLRWAVERGCAVIPKSSNSERLSQNLDLFSFELSAEEMEKISGLNMNFIMNDPADWVDTAIWAN